MPKFRVILTSHIVLDELEAKNGSDAARIARESELNWKRNMVIQDVEELEEDLEDEEG